MNNNKVQRNKSIRPTRFWIIGAGRFGQIALRRITRHIAGSTITVVDQKSFSDHDADITVIQAEGIEWLTATLNQDSPVDMIVPAIPVHVAAEWIKLNMMPVFDIYSVGIPASWLARMPNPLRGKTGQAFVSQADFICPDNCPEPEKICTHTGKPRPMDLFRLLGKLALDDVVSIVLRSHQLMPGVGGIYPADLLRALNTASKNCHRPLMIATACRCHGVVDFLRLEKKAIPQGDFLDILLDTR